VCHDPQPSALMSSVRLRGSIEVRYSPFESNFRVSRLVGRSLRRCNSKILIPGVAFRRSPWELKFRGGRRCIYYQSISQSLSVMAMPRVSRAPATNDI